MQRFRSSVPVVMLAVLPVLALALFNGCGDESAPDSEPAGGKTSTSEKPSTSGAEKKTEGETPAAAAVTAVDPATAGTITGAVKFSGSAPQKLPIPTDADANCAAMHKDAPLFPDDVVVNDNQTLRWVLVYVSKGLEGKTFPVPSEPVVFDQKGCHYEPHVFGIQAKQKIKILNSDATNHNVHSLPTRSPQFNVGMPNQGMEITKDFRNPEMPVKIKCEVHNWMGAWCGVFTHPYFGVSDQQGNFKIQNLPPGKYTLTAWHEKYGEKKQEVEVGPKETKSVEFAYQGS